MVHLGSAFIAVRSAVFIAVMILALQESATAPGGSPWPPVHMVSVVLMQAFFTPAVHVASAVHVVHGAFPEAEKDVPATHGTGLHTVSVVSVQAVLTPAVHVASAVHALHGDFPEAEKDVPATHGTGLHTVSAVLVQAVLTPAVHVASAVHVLHPVAFPEAEKFAPAVHACEEK